MRAGSTPVSAAASATACRIFASTAPAPAACSSAATYASATRSRSCSARDVRPSRLAHARGDAGLGEPRHRRDERLDLSVADRHLERDIVGQLREPADVADDERLPERQRANRAPRRLAHRRRAQQDAGRAGRHERPEPLLLDVRLADHALGVEPEPLQPPCEVEPGRLGADEEQPRSGMRSAELGEGAQQLRDALALVQMAEAAEERRALDPRRLDVRRGPGRDARCATAGRRSRARRARVST